MANTYNVETGWLGLECEAFGVVSAWKNTIVPLWHESGVDTRVVPEILKFVGDTRYFVCNTPDYILVGMGDTEEQDGDRFVGKYDTSKFTCKVFITMNVLQYWSAKGGSTLYERLHSGDLDFKDLHANFNELRVLNLEVGGAILCIPPVTENQAVG